MIRWLLSWLFPLWVMLPRARELGSVSFQEVAGVGWMATIRPPYTSAAKVNAWSGEGRSLGAALRQALALATVNPTSGASQLACAPKLGGAEFDDE